MRKMISNHSCPCCGMVFRGGFNCELVKYECDYGEEVVCELFRFVCPNSGKGITLYETSFSDMKLLWETRHEDIMDRYIVQEKVKSKYKDNALFYAYTPITENRRGDLELITEKIVEFQKKGYKATLVIPEDVYEMVKNIDLDRRTIKIWALEEKFFSMCRGTKYGSMLAELNILNELLRWKSYRIFSIYPTISDEFEYIGGDVEWGAIEQKILI